GYACDETREYMPATLILAQVIMKELAVLRREHNEMPYLRPDAKSQVT
ncbi:MAG TPA: methionine adenosyltransferase, partial [Alistipes sp.]|nr:methionine adenosyltransferase [Alistipes sp.]